MEYLQPKGDIGYVPRLVPVPTEIIRKLQALLSIDIEPDVGAGGLTGGVGKDDTRCQIPNGALAAGLHGLEIALDVRPVPVRLLLLVVLRRLLIHHQKIIIFSNVNRLHIPRAYAITIHTTGNTGKETATFEWARSLGTKIKGMGGRGREG